MHKYEFIFEIFFRFILFLIQLATAFMKPRMRKIHDEEWWLYSNPVSESYVPSYILLIFAFLMIFVFPLFMLIIKRNSRSVTFNAILGYTLASLLDICVTNSLKLLVGRPRPDFFYRCFPNGNKQLHCNGDKSAIIDGLKSFPSGHSSISMSCFGFISLFLIGQLRVFADEKKSSDNKIGNSCKFLEDGKFLGCKIIICLLPIFFAIFVCISRLMDFHHHFEDISVGAVIGLSIAFICYRLYFPSVFNKNCDSPKFKLKLERNSNCCVCI